MSAPRKSRLARLPTWLSFWLGYRETPPPPRAPYIVWFWSFVGAFVGLSAIQAIFGHVPFFTSKGVPSIGATAVLIYGAIESPLAQPRPVIGGHLLSALVGVCITKLFLLLPTEQRFLELSWLAGSLACAVSLVVMQMTGTTHPPAGATALVAAINPDLRRIGWFYLPVVLMAASIAILLALFTNNMQRQYPVFWWTPEPSLQLPSNPCSPNSKGHDVEDDTDHDGEKDLEKGGWAVGWKRGRGVGLGSRTTTMTLSRTPTMVNSPSNVMMDLGLTPVDMNSQKIKMMFGGGSGAEHGSGCSSPLISGLNTPARWGSGVNTPTESTVVSRRASISSFDYCRARDWDWGIDKSLALERQCGKAKDARCGVTLGRELEKHVKIVEGERGHERRHEV